MLADEIIFQLIQENNYEISLNTRFQLSLKHCGKINAPEIAEEEAMPA
jgi:hypothetical protein